MKFGLHGGVQMQAKAVMKDLPSEESPWLQSGYYGQVGGTAA